jgi:Trypsin-co-occurring domain 2
MPRFLNPGATCEVSMADQPSDALSIETLVRAVSDQLRRAREGRPGGISALEVSELTLDVSFVAVESDSGGGGVDLRVVPADRTARYDPASIQRLSLRLRAAEGQSFAVAAPVQARRTDDDDEPE